MTQEIKIKSGSRGSPLAKIQVEEIYALLKAKGIQADFEVTVYKTQGDKDKKTSLIKGAGDDFFTDTLDRALIDHAIDIAIHSAKDMPQAMKEGLSIFALTESADETDAFVGTASFADLKPGAKIGTSSEIRQKMVKALRPDIRTADIRGTIDERMEQFKKGAYDGIIVATIALKRLGLEEYIQDIMPWETTPLQGQLAVVGRSEDAALRALFAPIDVRRTYGRVCLVGAGPGDPDLITLKGVKALAQADCVFYDYLAHKDILKYAPQAEKIYVGKRKGAHALPQEELTKQLRYRSMAGKNVVRLKGGDPLIFGRGAEEIEYLRAHHIPVSVIPGVSSTTAIPSSLSVPLTARDLSSSVAFVSGHVKGETGSKPQPVHIPNTDTIVFLMGLTKLESIIKSLRKAGWKKDAPILIVSKGTCDNEHVIAGNLETIVAKVAEEQPEQPAMIIAGETVRFWNPRLHKREGTVLFTGTNPEKFRQFGTIIHLPMIEIGAVDIDPAQMQDLIDHMANYTMILLTSKFGVKYFFKIIEKAEAGARRAVPLHLLKDKKFLVIGKNTARALKDKGFVPTLVAPVETSEGLLAAITARMDVKGQRILFPRSSLPNPYLHDELTRLGAHVDQITVYQNVKPAKRDLPKEAINKILFTSPSTVKNFLEDYGKIPADWKILSKGPVTSKSLKEAGYESEVLTYG